MFFKIESWNFQVQFEIRIRETSQNFNSFSFFNCYFHLFFGCLIELKFCKVSRNSISNWTWMFQHSILKNKKDLFLKKYFFGRCQSRRVWVLPFIVSVWFRTDNLSKWVSQSYKKIPLTASTHAAQTFEQTHKQTKNIIGDHRETFTKRRKLNKQNSRNVNKNRMREGESGSTTNIYTKGLT